MSFFRLTWLHFDFRPSYSSSVTANASHPLHFSDLIEPRMVVGA